MANQWGRDSAVQSSGSRPGLVLPVIISLAVGGGLGFGYSIIRSEFLGGGGTTESDQQVVDLKKRITGLEDDLAAARTKLASQDESNDQASEQSLKVAELQIRDLEKQLADLSDENSSLKADLKAAGSDAATKKLKDQVAALQKANDGLAASYNTLQDQAISVKQKLEDQIDNMKSMTVFPLKTENQFLKAQVEDLKKQLSLAEIAAEHPENDPQVQQLRDQLKAASRELEATSQSLESITSERDTAYKSVADLKAQAAAQQKKLDKARAQIASLTEDNDALSQRLATLKQQGESSNGGAVADAEAAREAAEAALAQARSDLSASKTQLQKLKSQIKDLQDQLEKAQAAGQPGSDSIDTDPPPVDDGGKPAKDPEPSNATPRSADAVEAALRSAPGIRKIAPKTVAELAARLEAGECLTTALEAEFDRVPVLLLSHLTSRLDAGCQGE